MLDLWLSQAILCQHFEPLGGPQSRASNGGQMSVLSFLVVRFACFSRKGKPWMLKLVLLRLAGLMAELRPRHGFRLPLVLPVVAWALGLALAALGRGRAAVDTKGQT